MHRFSRRSSASLRAGLTTYDAAYVATAETYDCSLIIQDTRLVGAPGVRCDTRTVGV